MTETQDQEPKTKEKVDNSDALSTSALGTKPLEWSPENEMIMVEWCDIAQCYKWLHSRSHEKYASKNAWYTIPAIILSTISGTASFAQTSLPIAYQVYAPMVIGAINISVGILTTVQQYLKISELNEAHRVSSISWDKFARNIRIELAKKPDERMDAEHFLKLNRQEFDRLMETSPNIKADVIGEFESKFKGRAGSVERKRFEELKKPDICSVIVSANETRHHWYLEIGKSTDEFDPTVGEEELKSKDDIIKRQKKRIQEKEDELRRREKAETDRARLELEALEESAKQIREKEEYVANESKKIQDYIASFRQLYDRLPHYDEIYENMKDDMDIEILMPFLQTYSAADNV
jgi:hypothetical protein